MQDKIIYGDLTFGGPPGAGYHDILSGSCVLGESLTAAQLSVDTLTATVHYTGTALAAYSYGETVLYYHGSALIGKFYLTSVVRVGKELYKLTATSAVGLLDKSAHYGGVYNGLTGLTTAPEIAADIIGGAFDYTIDDAFDDTMVYGWLPAATRRANLQQLLFAVGANITKDANGDVVISALPSAAAATLPAERVFAGSGEITYPTLASAVKVTEHAYTADSTVDAAKIYEGEVIAETFTAPSGTARNGQLIKFSAPQHSLECTGATILESGANYAVLSASAGAVLTGKAYRHSTKIVRVAADGVSGSDYVPEVKSCTLVSLANSLNVAKRVLAYYGSKKDIKQDIVVGSERPGDRVTFPDAYDESNTGYIKGMTINFGSFLRATAQFDTGYIPTGIGNNYKHVMLVTAGGSFTLPSAARARFVLIGGGDGGGGGTAGEAGRQPDAEATVSSSTTEYELVTESSGMFSFTQAAAVYTWYKNAEASTGAVALTNSAGRLNAYYAWNEGAYYRRIDANHVYCLLARVLDENGNYAYLYAVLTSQTSTVTTSSRKAYYANRTAGGTGGEAGAKGRAGLVYQMDLDITPGGSANAVMGAGGNGGAAAAFGSPGGVGGSGGSTTLTVGGETLTSADGVRMTSGYTNLFTGAVVALDGADGVPGGAGGAYSGHLTATPGAPAGAKIGGGIGNTARNGINTFYAEYGGGSGGGASANNNGSKGGAASVMNTTSAPIASGGKGGNGGAASAASGGASYGSGGSGGNGGGGGGNGGGGIDSRAGSSHGSMPSGAAGSGGAGGRGGDGAAGVLLIYY